WQELAPILPWKIESPRAICAGVMLAGSQDAWTTGVPPEAAEPEEAAGAASPPPPPQAASATAAARESERARMIDIEELREEGVEGIRSRAAGSGGARWSRAAPSIVPKPRGRR